MGVVFFPCATCKEVICDCGGYVVCDSCLRKWCSVECAEKDGAVFYPDGSEEIQNCAFCRKENFSDKEIIKFLLKKVGKSRKAIIEEMRSKKK